MEIRAGSPFYKTMVTCRKGDYANGICSGDCVDPVCPDKWLMAKRPQNGHVLGYQHGKYQHFKGNFSQWAQK